MDGAKIFSGSDESYVTENFEVSSVDRSRFFNDGKELSDRKILYGSIKRVSDITISFFGLIVLFPVLLIAAIAILLEDGGPVFYTQKRIGEYEKEFKIYKFRSMCKNAEKIHESLREEYGCQDISFKLHDDPRITKVGKIIRKFNIDELPQLINILKGDMSLVGPRPLPDYEYQEEQRQYGNRYIERYSVPQGLTCIWQISNRSSVDFEDRMQMDVEYARKRGIWMDFKLIVKTFVFTVTGKAGY